MTADYVPVKRDPTKAAYSRLLVTARKKKKECHITIEEFKELKAQPCQTCQGPLEPTAVSLQLINKRKHFTKDNVIPLCKICQFKVTKAKFDRVKWAKSLLRRNWKRTPMAMIALQRAKVPGGWKCAKCGKVCIKRQFDLDHIKPTVATTDRIEEDLNVFVANLTCDDSNLQVLCKEHHREKTKKENKKRFAVDK